MGNVFTKLFDRLFGPKEARVLLLGLDAAGKTTFLDRLDLGEIKQTVPTIGFNYSRVVYKSVVFNSWDVGGQDKVRKLWNLYYENSDAIIFVVDSADSKRLDDNKEYENNAKVELDRIMDHDLLQNALLLVIANKQDLKEALPIQEIAKRLNLARFKNRVWHIQGTSLITGDGVYEGMDWLATKIKQKK